MRGVQKKRKRRLLGHRTDADGWQIVYTGFVLILLCFFVMLTSFASFQESKISQFVRSFSNAVTVFTDGKALEKGKTIGDNDSANLNKEDQLAKLFERVNHLGKMNGLDQLNLRRTPKGVVMTLSEKMLFSSGSATLSKASYAMMAKIGEIVKAVNVPIEIEGHTDDKPIRTRAFPSNWELSTDRAVNVLRFFTEQQQVGHQLVSAVGMSQYHPLVPNTSDENRNRNRRVEIIFIPE